MFINHLVHYVVKFGQMVDNGQKVTLCAKLPADRYVNAISKIVWIDHYVDTGLTYVNCPVLGVHNYRLDVTTAIIAW